MSDPSDHRLLTAVLTAWDRNNLVLLGLLRALPEGGLGLRAMDGGPTVAQLFAHLHSVRLSLVAENAPEVAVTLPEQEWADERDPETLARLLNGSAAAVRTAVQGRLSTDRAMALHYDHPVLMLGHLIWHEGYHHGQIKLALKLRGRPLPDEAAGPGTWGIWMRKTGQEPSHTNSD